MFPTFAKQTPSIDHPFADTSRYPRPMRSDSDSGISVGSILFLGLFVLAAALFLLLG